MATRHVFTSPKSDGADATLVRPSNWNASHAVDGAVEVVFDGYGSVITTGIKFDYVTECAGTWVSWTLLADQTGSIVIDVWKDSYANYPPTVADTITASAKPTLSSVTKNTSGTLTGWTKTFAKGDILRFNVDSATTVTRVTLALAYTEP